MADDQEMMKPRILGLTGLAAFPLGMGCSRLGSFLNSSSKKDVISTIRLAVDRGVNYFDTSDIYAQGDSERLLGAALGVKRDSVIVATKAGRCFSSHARLAARIKAPIKLAMRLVPGLRDRVRRARTGHLSTNFDLDYLTTSLNASLKRLQTDCVEVFMLHGPPAEILADRELFENLSDLVRQGKTRNLGVSVDDLAHASLAAELPGVRVIQLPVGPKHETALARILPEVCARGIALIGREVFDGADPHAGQAVRDQIIRQAMARPELSVVLVGMSTVAHLEANLAALV